MKILYAIQATGNGHISRAAQLMPYLRRYGNVDVFLSGANSQLPTKFPVKYRSNGLSLFYNLSGGLHYSKMLKQMNLKKVINEVKNLPVDNYDVVINDFECITSLACAFKKVHSVNFGHQASFQSQLVPRPEKKDLIGEFILKNYARASQYIGLHFEAYDNFIFPPVVKREILHAHPENLGHITVYLSSYSTAYLIKHFSPLKQERFQVFSKEVDHISYAGNITFMPVNQKLFNESMINSKAVITGAGFETPAEVMHLQKKLMVIPIRGQYEQVCNAAALKLMGVTVLPVIDQNFSVHFTDWMQTNIPPIHFKNVIPKVVEHLFENYPYRGISLDLLYPNMVLN